MLAITNAPQDGSSDEVFKFLKLLTTLGNPSYKYSLQVLHLLRPFKLDEYIMNIIETTNVEDIELLVLMMDREKSPVINTSNNYTTIVVYN